jgi:hypothetical protein
MYTTRQDITDLPVVNDGETASEFRKRMNDEHRGLQARNKYLEIEIEKYQITQDYATDLEKERDNLLKDYDELINKLKRIEHNFKYRRLGKYLVEDISYAVDEYPDKDVVDSILDSIKSLSDWGKQHNDRIDREEEHKAFDKIVLDMKENL